MGQSSPNSESNVETQRFDGMSNETMVGCGNQEVDLKLVKDHCEGKNSFPNEGPASMQFGALLDSRSSVTCVLRRWLLGRVLTSKACK